jgi:lipoyl(octanoyl) transferase
VSALRRKLRGIWLGRQRYAPVHALQKRLHALRQEAKVGDSVLLLEHEPVVTLGRGARPGHVLVPERALEQAGVDLVETGRGGDVTLHAPGQLVCYPIIDLAPDRCDVRRYVGDLTEVMRRIALELGIASGPAPELIGLWVDQENPTHFHSAERAERLAKIGAIGVRISRWVTMHGFALNLTTDLSLYRLIVPCGISAHGVTSIQALNGSAPSVRDAAGRALGVLADVLDADATELDDVSEQSVSAELFG